MKKIVFAVQEKGSFIKSLGWPAVKAGTKLPLVVPLLPGGKIELDVDEKKNVAVGDATNLQFVTDRFQANSGYYLTGKLQTMDVHMRYLNLALNPQTGVIVTGGGYTFVKGAQHVGGAGLIALWHLGPSSFSDANSPTFDLTDGLGCGGRLILEMGTGNPIHFVIHVEALVAQEDNNGDGAFDIFCPVGLRKWFRLDYEPPIIKIQIIFPEHPGYPKPWLPYAGTIQAMRLADLVKMAAGRRKVVPIRRIELSGAAAVDLLLLDSRGRVFEGMLSGKRTKAIMVPQELRDDLLVGVAPHLGVALNVDL